MAQEEKIDKRKFNKGARGRPPLDPVEKARRAEVARLKKNAKDTEKRRLKKEQKLLDMGLTSEEEFEERKSKLELKAGSLGGTRAGAGRPLGSKNIYSYDSVKKLEMLGFDPLEKLTDLYFEIEDALNAVTEDGKRVVKVGSLAHATMLGHLKGISDSLSKYSYRAVPERREIDYGDKTPTIITLTSRKPKEVVNDADEA